VVSRHRRCGIVAVVHRVRVVCVVCGVAVADAGAGAAAHLIITVAVVAVVAGRERVAVWLAAIVVVAALIVAVATVVGAVLVGAVVVLVDTVVIVAVARGPIATTGRGVGTPPCSDVDCGGIDRAARLGDAGAAGGCSTLTHSHTHPVGIFSFFQGSSVTSVHLLHYNQLVDW